MATSRSQIYRCQLCGNLVEVINGAGGTLSCCGQPMTGLEENTVDAAKEKHVPIITTVAGGTKVTVGSIAHPMEEKHYIGWIELAVDGKVYRQYLKPGEPPEAFFPVTGKNLSAREYCNLHGLWKADF